MKSLIFHLLLWVCLFMSIPLRMNAQSVMKPENDSTFITEFRDGDEWAVIARHGFVVGLNNKYIYDDYGKFYQLTIRIRNLTENPYTFDPDTVSAFLVNKRNDTIALKVYSSEGFQPGLRRAHRVMKLRMSRVQALEDILICSPSRATVIRRRRRPMP